MVVQHLSAPVFYLKRKARQLSKVKGIPLYRALDQIAREEGFSHWSLLAAHISHSAKTKNKTKAHPRNSGNPPLQLDPGDLILLAARPGHGKTVVSIEMLLEAVNSGRNGLFFTLEYNETQALEKIQAIASESNVDTSKLRIDSSDDISAPYIIERLASTPPGTVIVIDYLQLLDQKRTSPELGQQLSDLKQFAIERQICMIFISQIHRSFDQSAQRFPSLEDVRLPNPVDLALFNKTCFLHNREMHCSRIGKR